VTLQYGDGRDRTRTRPTRTWSGKVADKALEKKQPAGGSVQLPRTQRVHRRLGHGGRPARAAIKDDAELDLAELKQLLRRVQETIHRQPNRVRYCMNGFVIAVGCYVRALTDEATRTADRIGLVRVDLGATACKVPSASQYIDKVRQRGALGKKRKTLKC
jgi:hypothetical protein